MTSQIMQAYSRLPISFVRGSGVWLYDQSGKKYLDTHSGLGVCGLGHCHPAVTQAIQSQAEKLLHTSNIYLIEEQEALAQELCQIAEMDKAFFSNSGAEAVEAMLKISRLYAREINIANPKIIVTEKAYHGRTLAALSASGNQKIQAGFEPLFPGYIRVPFNDVAAIQQIAEQKNNDVVAVLIEPVLGNGGIVFPDDNYLNAIRQLCDNNQWLLMLDEIQCGLGRTGVYFTYQHNHIKPDLLATAKILGNGIPIAATLAKGHIGDLIQPGNHGSTYGGNPFAAHVARTVLKTIAKEDLITHINQVGHYFLTQLQQKLGNHPRVTAIRGKGLMLGIELDRPSSTLREIALEQGLLINITAEKVIRLLPPFIYTTEHVDICIDLLEKSLNRFEK